jgi:hypothetical protein
MALPRNMPSHASLLEVPCRNDRVRALPQSLWSPCSSGTAQPLPRAEATSGDVPEGGEPEHTSGFELRVCSGEGEEGEGMKGAIS